MEYSKKFKYLLTLICCIVFTISESRAYEFILQGNVFSEDNMYVIPGKELVFVNSDYGIFESTKTNDGGFYKQEFEILQDTSLTIYIYAVNGCEDSVMTIVDSVKSHNGWLDVNIYLCYREPVICNAGFTHEIIDSTIVQFYDTTIQHVVSWLWDFGDGGVSEEQNPKHVYNLDGNYRVELTIKTSNNCKSSYVDYITVEEGRYVKGYVYAGVSKLPKGRIVAYSLDNIEGEVPVDNNTYQLVDGMFSIAYEYVNNHILYFIPELDLPEYYAPVYFPTFLGNQEYCGNALSVSEEIINSNIIVNLIREPEFYYGHGKISGNLNLLADVKNKEVSILLFNSNKKPIKYLFFDSDFNFSFEDIPLGDYYLQTNCVGLSSDPISVSINAANKEIEVFLKEEMKNIVLSEVEYFATSSPFPNPFSDILFIPDMEKEEKIKKYIKVFNSRGELMLDPISVSRSTGFVDLGELENGIYLLEIDNRRYKIRKK